MMYNSCWVEAHVGRKWEISLKLINSLSECIHELVVIIEANPKTRQLSVCLVKRVFVGTKMMRKWKKREKKLKPTNTKLNMKNSRDRSTKAQYAFSFFLVLCSMFHLSFPWFSSMPSLSLLFPSFMALRRHQHFAEGARSVCKRVLHGAVALFTRHDPYTFQFIRITYIYKQVRY